MMRGSLSVKHVEWFLKEKNGMKTMAAHVVKNSYKDAKVKKTSYAACLVCAR